MANTNAEFDFFVSYARADNADGWITQFVGGLLSEFRKFSGGHELMAFFDKDEIANGNDWQLRIAHGLANSRLFLAFISPNYFASEWCRKEWRAWIDTEISKHILTEGVRPVYIVEVPGLTGKGQLGEQVVAQKVAELCGMPTANTGFLDSAMALVQQMRRRQMSDAVQPFYREGLVALQRDALHRVLEELAHDLGHNVELLRLGAESPNSVPPYNRNFSGRLEELLLLREKLKSDHAGVVCGVHGLGGIGKTELAFTYAHAFASAYPGGRYLIPCDGRSSLREAVLIALGDVFRQQIGDEERKNPETFFAAIRDCLRERLGKAGHVLLVLDNVTDMNLVSAGETDALTALGPKLHLLATTRMLPPSGKNWLTLGELEERTALELMEKHRPFAHDDEKAAACSIVRRLGGFTLAIELVAAWLGAHPEITCRQMANGIGLEDLETIAKDETVESRRHNHEKRLSAVLAPVLDGLTPAELRAVEYAALLSADCVALPWLRTLVTADVPGIGQTTRMGNPWEDLCRRLQCLALFTRLEGETNEPCLIRMHRLLQDLLRSRMPAAEFTCRQKAVEELIEQRVAALKQTTKWTDARWEVEPLDALANQWAATNHQRSAWLLSETGLYWRALAEWQKAQPLLRRALAMVESRYGTEHPRVATGLNNLAILLQDTNRLTEAEPLLRRALAIWEKSYGPDHPEVATGLNNLAYLLQATNRFAEPELLLRRALAIDEKSYGPTHSIVASSLNNLARLLQATNRLAEAEPLLRRALTIFETSYGPEHPYVATGLNNLAALLQDTNRLVEAEPLLRRALALDEMSYGPEHPDVASSLNNLADLLQTTNQWAKAEPLMHRVLAIYEKSFGPEHPNVATGLSNLARLLKATNRLTEAETLDRRSLAIREKGFGPEHPSIATSLISLTRLLQATNRLAEAEPLVRRALAIFEASYGPDHPEVATGLNNLAQLLQAMNRLAEAEPLVRRALAIDEASYGPKHPVVASSLNNLARLLQATNRLAEAEPLVRRALAIFETSYGAEHPYVAAGLNSLGLLLHITNRPTEAEPLYRRALAINEKSFGPEHPDVANCLNNLALLLQATNRRAEAEPLLRRSLEIAEISWGTLHPTTANGWVNLGRLLFDLDDLQEAESLAMGAIERWQQGETPNDPARGKAHLILGIIEVRRKNQTLAKEQLLEALRLLNLSSGIFPFEITEAKNVLASLGV
jgi:tetratricopeptide (TPR) repeat protein